MPQNPQKLVDSETVPVHQSLYPTKDSLREAREYIEAQVPVTDPNEMHALLMLFQNTLLHVQEKQ